MVSKVAIISQAFTIAHSFLVIVLTVQVMGKFRLKSSL